jgi:3-phosphoshikimate 1-carboxyvinyltransferase
MIKNIVPFQLNKTIQIPASKSVLQRLIALAGFCNQESFIKNINWCDDVNASIHCIKDIGASVEIIDNSLKIKGIEIKKYHRTLHLNVNESGLSARMFGLMVSVLFQKVYLKGKGSLLNRSMKEIVEVLEMMNCKVNSNHFLLPLEISGFADLSFIKLNSIDSSQTITGLIYTSVLSQNEVYIKIKNPVSIPYIQLSIDCLNKFGVTIHHNTDFTEYIIFKNSGLSPVNITAEGDWSNAAFFIVGAALSGKCILENLNPDSLQGDKKIVEIVQQCGARIFWTNDKKLIVEKNELNPINVDLKHYPDLFPPLCVLALGINGISQLKGVSRLVNKESNRAMVLMNEFKKLGAELYIEGDTMIIKGKGYLSGGEIDSNNDHRIAMAGSIAATIAQSPVNINNPQAVSKSYPEFFNHLLS